MTKQKSDEDNIHKKHAVVIVGAGAAGLFTGYLLKKRDPSYDITILEEHSTLKKTCSGIFTHRIYDILNIPERLVLARVSKTRIYSAHHHVDIEFARPDIVVDRKEFNEHLYSLATSAGCKVLFETKFESMDYGIVVAKTKDGELRLPADILIGADGAMSSVAKAAGLFGERTFYLGIKSKAKMELGAVIFYPSIKDFAWISPMGPGIVEVGMAIKIDKKNPVNTHKAFKEFVATAQTQLGRQIEIYDFESALIPEYKKIKVHTKIHGIDVYLVGDSALQVKATTLGGVVYNTRAAVALVDAILGVRSYNSGLRSINRELYMHRKARDVFSRFSSKDWDRLVHDFNNPKLIKILSEESRDHPRRIAVRTFFAKPTLVKYLRFLVY